MNTDLSDKASPQPAGVRVIPEGWQHVENEWADGATSAIQWLRNIRDGISTAEEALNNVEPEYHRVLALSRALEPQKEEAVAWRWKPDADWATWTLLHRKPGNGLIEPLYTHPTPVQVQESQTVSEEAIETARHWIDRYAAGIDEEPQMDRIIAALEPSHVKG